ncbi:F0F1 ATP synthase subunit delta [Candidatus Kaiserbacteria bacterium]|nr:F0F1 ATP synthase subunit delta [Candidatus Kaiserbacteria bacterium]
MKYKAAQYAEALVGSIVDAEPEVARTRIRAFAALLRRHRMLGKAESIMRVVERRLASRAGAVRVTLETPESAAPALQKQVSDVFDGKAWIEEKVRPELLAGVRILVDDETLVDASAKRRLAQMFRHAA